MNVWTFSGRVGADAELRTTQSGEKVLSFRVANDIGFGDRRTTLPALRVDGFLRRVRPGTQRSAGPQARGRRPGGELNGAAGSQRSRIGRGVALYAAERQAVLRQGFTAGDDSPADTERSLPMPGFEWVAASRHYAAYVRC